VRSGTNGANAKPPGWGRIRGGSQPFAPFVVQMARAPRERELGGEDPYESVIGGCWLIMAVAAISK